MQRLPTQSKQQALRPAAARHGPAPRRPDPRRPAALARGQQP